MDEGHCRFNNNPDENELGIESDQDDDDIEMATSGVFHGRHWAELSAFLGLSVPEEEHWNEATEAYLELQTRTLVLELAVALSGNSGPSAELTARIAGVRAFTTRIRDASDGLDFTTPLWDGLLQVQDDFTFLGLVETLLPKMLT